MKTALLLTLIILISTQAYANFARISRGGFALPANDLIYQGQKISPEKARELKINGIDISTLNPTVEKRGIWINSLGESLDSSLDAMPVKSGDSVEFQGTMRSAPGEFRFSVTTKNNEIVTIYADKKLHTTLLRKNFLRKLGYIVPSIKHLKNLSVSFESEKEKEHFTTKFRRGAEGTTKRWIEADLGLTLILRDLAAVQVSDTDLYNPAFGVPGGALNSRKLRALVLPYALLDLKESVNKFSWSVGRKENADRIILPHFFSNNNFATTTMEDATWIARRIAKLTRQDFEEVVEAAHFPSPVAKLVVEKLLSRRNALIDLFKISNTPIEVETKVSEMPHLLNGKIIKRQWRDYGFASEFAAGDATSPFKDFNYYIYSLLQSIGIDSIISRANQELTLFDPLKARMALAEEEFLRGLNHFVETGEFLQFPVSTWTSPIVNGNLILSRDVVVGNYLGTENLVQLADTFGYALSLGAIMGVENVDVLDAVTLSANATYLKTFTHLKPLASLKDVFKQKYKNLAVILLKNDLRKHLKNAVNQSENQTDENVENQTKFFGEVVKNISSVLGVGESLIISEKILPSFSVGAKIPITQSGFVVGVGAGVDYIGVKRLQILRRDANTIQIYDDTGSAKGADFTITLENRIPILRFEYRVLKGQYNVKSFRVNIDADAKDNPHFMQGIEGLHSLLTTNSSELLQAMAEDGIGPASSNLKAKFHDKYSHFAFLFWRSQRNRGLSDYEVETSAGLSGTYITHHDHKRKGLNWESFTKDLIKYGLSKLSKGNNILWRNDVWQNPANTFSGAAKVFETDYEGQIKNGKLGKEYISFGRRYEGWSKKQKKLRKLVTRLNNRFQVPLFTDRQIDDIKKLNMYDVLAKVNIYDRGVKAIKKFERNKLIALASHFDRKSNCPEEFKEIYDYTQADGSVVQVVTCGRLSSAINLIENCPKRETIKAQTKCWMYVAKSMFEDLPFTYFSHHIVGRNNFYLEGTANGFRHNDEVLNDPIRSNGYGRRHPIYPYGMIKKVQQRVGIQNGEFTGQWLREWPQ